MSNLTKQNYTPTAELINALKQGRVRIDSLSIESLDAVQIFPNYRGGDAIAILIGAIKARDQEIERLREQLGLVETVRQTDVKQGFIWFDKANELTAENQRLSAELKQFKREAAEMAETDKPAWDRCCDRPLRHFIGSGGAFGSGASERHHISVCTVCGQFKVEGYKQGQHYRVVFWLWSSESLAAAGKALERSEITEKGEIGAYLDRLEAIANELSRYIPHGDDPEPAPEYPGWFELMAAEQALGRAIDEARKSLESNGGK